MNKINKKEIDPKKRYSTEEMLKHKWLSTDVIMNLRLAVFIHSVVCSYK